MNLFVLDTEPRIAATMQCDKHVTKMSIEYAQILSGAHHLHQSPHTAQMYKLTHRKHPATLWTAAHPEHYRWVYALACATWDEYTHRYKKIHASSRLRVILAAPPLMTVVHDPTPPPQCMPDIYKVPGGWDATVAAYRQYYRGAKASFATWKLRDVPAWFVHSRI